MFISFLKCSNLLADRLIFPVFVYNRLILARSMCNKNASSEKVERLEKEKMKIEKFPEAPTTCCQSGCANCVWLEYVEQLTNYFKDGGEKALKDIDEKIDDPSLKAFLLQEVKMRFKS